MSRRIVRTGDSRLEPVANASHFVNPHTGRTLCAEPIGDDWEAVATDADLIVNCDQCHVQKYWLPAFGKLERHATLPRVIEPWPAEIRKHVTTDDDPRRGRSARPPHLQLCLSCCSLRGPLDRTTPPEDFDNLCACDRREWDRDPVPRYGDLDSNAALCRCCVATVVRGGTRWSCYYCADCGSAIALLRRRAGHSIVPMGPHSLMNGVSAEPPNGQMTSPQAIAFHDQLKTLFANQDTLHNSAQARTRHRATQLGLHGHATPASRYTTACAAGGFTPKAGFIEFIQTLDDAIDPADAEALWVESRPTTRLPRRPSREGPNGADEDGS